MPNRKIYTRTYSANSPRKLVSGKGPLCSERDPLSPQELLNEFSNHRNRGCRIPTALVSVSTRIVDTVQRAFTMNVAKVPEAPEDILIIFIEVPETEGAAPIRVHKARLLAETSGLEDAKIFQYEMLFEWEIPETYVLHRVSLRTLLDRGIGEYIGLGKYDLHRRQPQPLSSTEALRCYIGDILKSEFYGGYYRFSLGFFAKTFGARAPVGWIAYQLFADCRLPGTYKYDDWVKDVDQVLIDWWLTDDNFVASVEVWEAEKDTVEDRMQWSWIYFWEEWHGKGCPGDCLDECISKEEMIKCNKERKRLEALERDYQAEIEEEAITLGL